MNKKQVFIIFLMIILILQISSCKKTVTIKLYDDETLITEKKVSSKEEVSFEDLTKENYIFIGWYTKDDKKVEFPTEFLEDTSLYAKWEEEKPIVTEIISYTISGKQSVELYDLFRLAIKYDASSEHKKINWEVSDESILSFTSTSDTGCQLEAVGVGNCTIKASSAYEDGTMFETTLTITVNPYAVNIDYDLEEGEEVISQIDKFLSSDLPLTLPIATKENYLFVGWSIDGSDDLYTKITIDDYFTEDITLKPVFVYPHIDLSIEKNNNNIAIDEETSIVVKAVNIPDNYLQNGFTYVSSNEDIVSVDENGKIVGVSNGITYVTVSLNGYPNIMTTIGVKVDSSINDLNEVLKYFVNISTPTIIAKTITVTGWQKVYQHDLLSSVIPYLFEDLEITENIAPLSNANRPGNTKTKYYITVHDTGDAEYTALQWSNTVYTNYNAQNGSTYNCSYHYVVGNDGIYHNIPDNEVSWHAGDGTAVEYTLYPTGVSATSTEKPTITITTNGYYAINGIVTSVLAPTNSGKILTTADINDAGIRCVIQNDEYYIGATWYSSTYRKIANNGGNNNSIGIESCINYGTDIFYTWQRLAKLVAKLMDEFSLTIDDVVPHHYFSGKNCPQTMRAADMWEYFLNMVTIEYNVLQFVKAGYTITFSTNDTTYVNSVGRVIKWPTKTTIVKYTITVAKDDMSSSYDFVTTIPGSLN